MNTTTDSKPVFQWTDELVKEYGREFGYAGEPDIEEFKKLHQQPKEAVVPIKVEYITKNTSMGDIAGEYFLCLNDNIPEGKLEAVKKAIEECLNGFKSNFGLFMPTDIARHPDGTAKIADPKYSKSVWMTEEKYNEEMENVWNAARLTHPLAGMKFDTFEDYKASISVKSFNQSEFEQGIKDSEKYFQKEQPIYAEKPTFEKSLESLINQYSKENDSDTPDFILAGYLLGCLDIYNKTLDRRSRWYGKQNS